MSGVVQAGLRTVGGFAFSLTAGALTSQAFQPPEGAAAMAVWLTPAGTTGAAFTAEVQWSNNGTSFYSADPKDTFASIGIGSTQTVTKYVTVKAPFYRIVTTGATTAGTVMVQDHPLSYSIADASGWEEGASGLPGATVGYIAATTLAATVTQATTTTYTAITPVPLVTAAGTLSKVAGSGIEASRISLLVNCTANTWTSTATLQIYWSLSGLAYNVTTNALPLSLAYAAAGAVDDVFTAQTAPFNVFKEIPVLAPYFAIGFSSGTPGSATFTVDVAATAL
jgi:hypothetical protein